MSGGILVDVAMKKITVRLAECQVEEMRAFVALGRAASVSAFVRRALGTALRDATKWTEMIEEALRETGGPLTRKERAWADRLLSGLGRCQRR